MGMWTINNKNKISQHRRQEQQLKRDIVSIRTFRNTDRIIIYLLVKIFQILVKVLYCNKSKDYMIFSIIENKRIFYVTILSSVATYYY